MTVFRVSHQENYVVLNKSALEDPILSFKAKGLWAYCMSRPNGWQFHISHLVTVSKDGRDAVYAAMKELEVAGYVRKVQANEAGRFGPVDYEISELKKFLPLTGFPLTENPPLVSNDSQNTFLKEKKEPPPPKKTEKRKFLEGVKLTEDEHSKLVLDLGQVATDQWIQALNDYILSKGDKYKNHYQTILNWIKRDGPRAQPGAVRPSEQVIAKRKEFAKRCDMKRFNGFDVAASKEYVEFTKGSFSRQVRYDASVEAWEETTGWKDGCGS